MCGRRVVAWLSSRTTWSGSKRRRSAELAGLHSDPVFYGRGVPRGDGRLVVVVPGLFGNDMYLQPLRGWLQRMGYSATRSSLTLNAGCPNRLAVRSSARCERQLERTPVRSR